MRLSRFKALIASCAIAISPVILMADSDSAGDVIPAIAMEQFRVLEGQGWEGGLTYLDYGSGERTTIPVKLEITILSDRTLQYAIQYPGETQYNNKEKLKIDRKGTRIDGFDITAVKDSPDGVLTITSEGKGKDDGKKADIQKVYIVSPKEFRIRKNVRFAGESDWLNRNEYHLER